MLTTYEALESRVATQRNPLVSNALVRQNDAIRHQIDKSEDADELRECLQMLNFVKPLWDSLNYGYKVKELASIAVNRAYVKEAEAKELRGTSRKSSTQFRLWDCEAIKLDKVITNLCILRG